LATLGIGLGLGNGPSVTAAVESAPRRMAGAASGTSSMMRYAGSIIGAGLLAGVLSSSTRGNADIMTFPLVSIGVGAAAHLAVVFDVYVVDEAELDDAHVDLGVEDVLETLHNQLFGEQAFDGHGDLRGSRAADLRGCSPFRIASPLERAVRPRPDPEPAKT